MSYTLLEICQKVAYETGVSTSFTSFTENDDSNLIKYYVNKAQLEIYDEILPKNSVYANTQTGTITTTNGLKTYNISTNTNHFRTNDLAFRIVDGVNQIVDLYYYNKENVLEIYKDLNGTIAKPYIIYAENSTQVSFFPVPDNTYTINYYFTPFISELTSTTDTFIFPDNWLRLYVVPKAAYYYLESKQFPDAESQAAKAKTGSGIIISESLAKDPIFISNQLD